MINVANLHVTSWQVFVAWLMGQGILLHVKGDPLVTTEYYDIFHLIIIKIITIGNIGEYTKISIYNPRRILLFLFFKILFYYVA